MPSQLTFDLPVRHALGRSDFFVAPSNEPALAFIDAWQTWPGGKLLLVGAAGSGKTHLAHVWADQAGARIVQPDENPRLIGQNCALDDLDQLIGDPVREEALFHLHNHLSSAGHALLIASRVEPARLDFVLPDLKSRMIGTQLVRIDAPDEALMAAVMAKQFDDRQLHVSPGVLTYVVARLPRTLAAVHHIVNAVDDLALARARPVTRALMSEVLDTLPANFDDAS